MKLWEIIRGKKESQAESEEFIQEEEELEEDLLTDTLNLGWYWSEDKQGYQMAKIFEEDRATHFYIVGASGTGKSKFLEFLIREDIKKGNGFGVIDPHGDLVEDLKGYLSLYFSEDKLKERILLINPVDEKYTVFFNPLEQIEDVSSAEISA